MMVLHQIELVDICLWVHILNTVNMLPILSQGLTRAIVNLGVSLRTAAKLVLLADCDGGNSSFWAEL
jgi:hypothetical protein